MKKEKRKVQVLHAVARLTGRLGYPPSYRDIGEELGIAHSSVFYVMEELRTDGLINGHSTRHSRSITLTDAGRSAIGGGGVMALPGSPTADSSTE